MKKLNQQGYNLVELVLAVAILAAMASSVMMARTFMAKQTVRTSDKAYATQKAIQMFEELRALVNGNEKAGVSVLDDFSDGSQYNTVLTTDKNIDLAPPGSGNAADPLSSNRPVNGHWRYLRQIQVNRLANDPYVRQVVIKVWRYATDAKPTQPGELLASVGGMLRTITSLFPPTQVMDVYVITIDNTQAWWAVLPDLSNTVQGVIGDIQGRNPGLQIHTHLITRSSFGRDSQYIPYINSATLSNALVEPYAYFYPGNTPRDSGTGLFFDPGSGGVQQDGIFNVDGVKIHPSTPLFPSCPDFAVCDQSNHAMRYPDEYALYQAVSQAWFTAVTAPGAPQYPMPEISERMLIEGMNSSPQSFTNAMILNMHGEVCPLPPLRNYSDAAKDPDNLDNVAGGHPGFNATNVRVVTHPELLYYPTDSATSTSVTINLRVYAYYDGLDNIANLDATYPPGGNQTVPAISLYFPDAPVTVQNAFYVYGNSAVTYKYDTLTLSGGGINSSGAAAIAGDTVSMKYSNVGPGSNETLITLYNTSLRAPPGPNNTGLNAADRLYGLEYIPCSPEQTALNPPAGSWNFTFGQGLTVVAGAGTPKNTARWILQVSMPITTSFNPSGLAPLTIMTRPVTQIYTSPVNFFGQHTIETRIGGTPALGGVTTNIAPSNLSRTYIWSGQAFPPPYTERYQMVGDPRHMPYLDVKCGGVVAGAPPVIIEGDAYNWYFKNIPNGTDGYSGFDKTAAGWNNGIENDIPKYDRLIRQGLMNTTSIWTTLNGFSFYYYGLGGEWGFDHAPYSNGITLNTTLFNTTATGAYDSTAELVNWASNINNERVVSSTNGNWYAKYWMGELYPDSQAANWVANGNLPTAGAAADSAHFYRKDCGTILGVNTLNGFRSSFIKVQVEAGCAAFFDGGDTTSRWFMHDYYDGNTGARTGLAATCYSIFQYDLPSVVNLARPWAIDDTNASRQPPEWNTAPYNQAGVRPYLSVPNFGIEGVRQFFTTTDNSGDSNTNNWYGSGVVEMRDKNAAPTKRGYVVETGTSPSALAGSQELSEASVINSLRTFLDGGQVYASGTVGHIAQIPLVKLYSNIVPQFSAPATIPLVIASPVTTGGATVIDGLNIPSGPTTDVWYRYPGVTSNTANYYTEEYPNYGLPLTTLVGYSEPVSLIYNLKYSNNSGKNWLFMQDGGAAVTGILDTTNNRGISVDGANPITWYNLNTPAAQFPQGDYWFMVEAYRLNKATGVPYPLHYAYHTLDITINR